MIARDKTINAWQTGIMLFILMFANKILILPSLLYEGAGLESFIIPIVSSVLELGVLFVFYMFKKKFPNESFFLVLKKKIGFVAVCIAAIMLMIYFLGKAILLYNVTFIFFQNVIYKKGSNFLFLICFLPIINHLVCLGLRSMARSMQLFFPVILVLTVFCITVGCFGIKGEPLFFESSPMQLAFTGFQHISAFGDVIFLFVIMDKIEIKKGDWKIIFSFTTFALLLVVVITTIFVFSYTYTAFMHPFALFEIMNYVKEVGGTGRIDILSMVLIILMAYFQLAIYLKGFAQSFNAVFWKAGKIYSILSFNILFFIMISYVVLNLEYAVFYGENILPYVTISTIVLLILICALCCFIRVGRKKV